MYSTYYTTYRVFLLMKFWGDGDVREHSHEP